MSVELNLGDPFSRYTEEFDQFAKPDFHNEPDIVQDVPEKKKVKKRSAGSEREKSEQRHIYRVYINEKLFAQLKTLCTMKGVSVNARINEIIETYVSNELRKNPELRDVLDKI